MTDVSMHLREKAQELRDESLDCMDYDLNTGKYVVTEGSSAHIDYRVKREVARVLDDLANRLEPISIPQPTTNEYKRDAGMGGPEPNTAQRDFPLNRHQIKTPTQNIKP